MRLCPLLRAVLLSRASRPSCDGIRRLSGLGGGAARSRPPVVGAGPGVCRRRYERVYPAQVWDPHAPLCRLVGVEPPDPRFNEVVRDLCPGGDGCLELSHRDVGSQGMWQGDYGKKPVRVGKAGAAVAGAGGGGCVWAARGTASAVLFVGGGGRGHGTVLAFVATPEGAGAAGGGPWGVMAAPERAGAARVSG